MKILRRFWAVDEQSVVEPQERQDEVSQFGSGKQPKQLQRHQRILNELLRKRRVRSAQSAAQAIESDTVAFK